jgi:hypothetical protein
VLVRAWHLTDAHVIRLGREQGTYQTPRWPTTAARRRDSVDVRGTWREVLDVYRDRAALEAVYGEWQPPCVHPGCYARLRETGWHVLPAFPATHGGEHESATRLGQMDDDLEKLADQVWEDSESSILIRVCIHEFSDPGHVEDLFVVLNRNDLIEAQSLPAAGSLAAAGRDPAWGAGQIAPAVLDRLILSAGELWHSTSGHDPYDVLSAAQREALDLAAAVYRGYLDGEMGGAGASPVCPECGTDQWDWVNNDRARCKHGHEWDQPAGDDLAGEPPARDGCAAHAGGILLTSGQLREWAGLGRDLTGGELADLDECIGSSSIPDAIATIVSDALKLRPAGPGDGAERATGSSS